MSEELPIDNIPSEGVMSDQLPKMLLDTNSDVQFEANGSSPIVSAESPQLKEDFGESVQDVPVDHSDNAGRWDKQQAETLAPAVQKEFSGELDSMAIEQQRLANPDYDDGTLLDLKRRREGINEDVENGQFKYGNGAREVRQLDKRIQQYRDTRHENNLAASGYDAEIINEMFDKRMSPYVELYETNPDTFGSMPTSEFMKIAEDYAKTCKIIDFDISDRNHLGDTLSRFQATLNNGYAATDSHMGMIVDESKRLLQEDGDEEIVVTIDTEFAALQESYSKKNQVKKKQQLAYITNLMTRVDQTMVERIQRRLDILDSYKSTESTQ